MIPRPDPMQAVYLAAVGAVAVAVLEPASIDRAKSDVIMSRDPWELAARRERAVLAAFWYVDARAADRARSLFVAPYLGGSEPADIARMISRTCGGRYLPHATMMAAANSTIAEIDRRFDRAKKAGDLKQINRSYKDYRIGQWAANQPAKSWEDYLVDLKKEALRRSIINT